jgi:two-component system response regulator
MEAKHRQTKHVLVAEDDPNDLLLLERAAMGVQEKARFHFVRDGEELLHYMKGEGAFADRAAFPLPNLVVLDIHLPKINGIQLLHWIRSQPRLAGLKIIVWSGSEYEAEFATVKAAGADGAMARPRSFEELQALIRGFAASLSGEDKASGHL